MFLIVPISTDAPIYHRPIATIGLIAVNTIVHGVLVGSGNADWVDHLILWHGDGLHPLQWITSNFVHEDVWHLVGNMIFLWVFGLVVEGQIGWGWFLFVYLGLGAVQCALEQICMLGAGGGASLGASAIIFGLVGMALIWAPMSETRCFYFVWVLVLVRTGFFEITIRTLAIVYFALELVDLAIEAALGEPGTSLLHLSGAVLGLALGVFLLRRGLVDCDGWDIFSIRHGRGGEARQPGDGPVGDRSDVEPGPASDEELEASRDEQRESALELMRGYVSENDPAMAATIYRETVAETGPWVLPRDVLLELIRELNHERAWSEIKDFLKQAIQRFPRHAPEFKLLLARALIEGETRPARALELLESISESTLSPANLRGKRALVRRAGALRASGAIELDEEI